MTRFGIPIAGLCVAFFLADSCLQAQPPNRAQQGQQARGQRSGGGRAQGRPNIGGQSGPGGQRGATGRGGPQSNSRGRSGGSSAGRGQSGGGGGGRKRDPARGDAAFATQLKELDSNKDGRLTVTELPLHMHDAFQVADADKNDSLNDEERLVLAQQFRRDRLPPPAEQGLERKNQPTQGRPQGNRQ